MCSEKEHVQKIPVLFAERCVTHQERRKGGYSKATPPHCRSGGEEAAKRKVDHAEERGPGGAGGQGLEGGDGYSEVKRKESEPPSTPQVGKKIVSTIKGFPYLVSLRHCRERIKMAVG